VLFCVIKILPQLTTQQMYKISIAIFISLFISFIHVEAQSKADIGFFGGTSFYMGDINQKQLFYSPGYSIGGLYRHNINDHYALRANAFLSRITGNDLDFPEWNHPDRFPAEFSTSMFDISANVEFNFLPYMPCAGNLEYTPYITGGIGYSLIMSSTVPASDHFSIPFGAGAKLNLTNNISAGAEWTMKKTFTDNLDGIESPIQQTNLHNNDWYSYFGVYITFKFFTFAEICPAYD